MLRNTFINSQVGPVPPAHEFNNADNKQVARAIIWVDEKGQQKGLVTNKSNEDLVHRVAEDLTPIETHKQDAMRKNKLKCAIKPF